MNKTARMAELGYDLHTDYWHKGLMSGAIKAAIDYAINDRFIFHLNRIEALTCVDHSASVALLLRLGFKEEGIRREYGWWKGQAHDLSSFSLIKRDWMIDVNKDR